MQTQTVTVDLVEDYLKQWYPIMCANLPADVLERANAVARAVCDSIAEAPVSDDEKFIAALESAIILVGVLASRARQVRDNGGVPVVVLANGESAGTLVDEPKPGLN